MENMMKKAKAVWKAEAAAGVALGTAAHAERNEAFAMFSQPYAAELPAVRADISLKNKLFWAWNGAVEPAEVRRQVADFKQKGFGGFFIHARGGLLVPYMGEKWMQAVEAAVDSAKRPFRNSM